MSFSQSYYRTKKSGAYNSTSTWEMSNDSITWAAATSYPNSVNARTINSSNTVITPKIKQGVYFIKVITDSDIHTEKIIKE